MKIEIEVDEDKLQRKLSARERAGIRLLIVIFAIVYPCKWKHELKEVFAEIIKDL
jgi:hypothetical protein